MKSILKIPIFFIIFLLYACTTRPFSESGYAAAFPSHEDRNETGSAKITFSADIKYESYEGVPLKGFPLVCKEGSTYSAVDELGASKSIYVEPGQELATGSIVSWYNSGWAKRCYDFVSFVPEKGEEYIVVNERIGGKRNIFVGVALQRCEVSVYKITNGEKNKIHANKVEKDMCSDGDPLSVKW
ncbi:hypothetical protein ACJJI5_11180 [Microbulbifer sp. EKSA008]|uniref:hypothetical protein n=1 Tax=unclassified Microbulbifer TaxID=2619833 RepID=UPI00403A242F